MDLDAALANAKRPERTVGLCLRGDLQAEWENLERELLAEQRKDSDSLAGNPRARELAEQMQTLAEQMKESTVVLRLRGITNPEWERMVADHPPRDGNATDKALGYDTSGFFPALVGGYTDQQGEHHHGCLVDVTPEQWARLYPVISSGQFDELSDAALAVSRRRVDPPKSFAASEILRSSEAASSSPAA